jgi:hypothetical protein
MAFKMRSGNTPKFKMVGSSPMKVDESGLIDPHKTQNALEYQERRNEALQKRLAELESKRTNTATRNERILKGEGSEKDRAEQAMQWKKKQDYLNKMTWNSKNATTGDASKDRWSGTRLRDLRFSFKDAIMGGDLTSGFSTKGGGKKSNNSNSAWLGGDLFGPRPNGGGRRRKKNKNKNSCTLTACPAFATGPQLSTDMN